jgi:hypothetical protein
MNALEYFGTICGGLILLSVCLSCIVYGVMCFKDARKRRRDKRLSFVDFIRRV